MRKQAHCPNPSLYIINDCKLQSDTCKTDKKQNKNFEQDWTSVKTEMELSSRETTAIQPVAMREYGQPVTKTDTYVALLIVTQFVYCTTLMIPSLQLCLVQS